MSEHIKAAQRAEEYIDILETYGANSMQARLYRLKRMGNKAMTKASNTARDLYAKAFLFAHHAFRRDK